MTRRRYELTDEQFERIVRHLQGELDAEGRTTGASSRSTARLCRPLEPLQAAQTTTKRGPDPARGTRSKPRFGYGRGGFSTKVHLLIDRQGLPLATVLTAGHRHETIAFTDLMNEVSVPRPRGRPRKRPEAVAGDRAYDADWIRQWCRDRSTESVIPTRPRKGPGRPPTCDSRKYSGRNTVERCVGRLKERRRLVVRYEKKASHSEATASQPCCSGHSFESI